MVEEADRGAAELALRGLSVQPVVQQRLEHQVHLVLLARLGEDEDVVAVHLHKLSEHGRAGARRPTAGRARPVESNDKASRPKIECMKRVSTDDIPCRPKAPTRNSYWPPGTRNDVL